MSENILAMAPPKAGQRIAYGEDPNQFAELMMPGGAGPHPVVIFIHGGFWRAAYDLTHARHFCAAIADAGFAVWSVEYRRVGQPGGGYPGTLNDVCAAAQRMTHIGGLDLSRVVVAGHSAGGQLALWLAASDTIVLQGVAALAAVSDLRHAHSLQLGKGAIEAFLGCSPTECARRYAESSPIEMLPLKVPQLVVHGTADEVVPFEFSRRFVAASGNARLVPLEGAGHFELIDPRAKEWPAVLENILAFMGQASK